MRLRLMRLRLMRLRLMRLRLSLMWRMRVAREPPIFALPVLRSESALRRQPLPRRTPCARRVLQGTFLPCVAQGSRM